MPGTSNGAADAMSRYPSPHTDPCTQGDVSEIMIAAALNRELEEGTTISWARLKAETRRDNQLTSVIDALDTNRESWKNSPELTEYARYSESLYESDGVVLYHDRAVIPKSLRQLVVEGLHSAHQGVSTMERRAKELMFWPGMTNDMYTLQYQCPIPGPAPINTPSPALYPLRADFC